MRISHTYKFIFYANPKTGSESVRKLLDPYSDVVATDYRSRTPENPFYSHITPRETRDIFDRLSWDFADYTSFTFVRNPWARLVSLYEMIYAGRWGLLKPPFQRWIQTISPNGRGGGGPDHQRWRRYGTYSIRNFICDEAGDALVDRVLRLEDIDRDLLPFLRGLGLTDLDELPVPHVNSRRKRPYLDYYDDTARRRVADLYAYDIATFDYRFGE